MRTFVVSLPNTSDRVLGGRRLAYLGDCVKETLVLLSAHPWIYSVSQRLETPTVSAAIRSRREVNLSSAAGNDSNRPRPCENSAAAYVQRSTGTCDSAGHVRPPELLVNCDPSTRLDRNILKWRNVFSGPILSFHTGWANNGLSSSPVERIASPRERTSPARSRQLIPPSQRSGASPPSIGTLNLRAPIGGRSGSEVDWCC